jgi:hypothetical protein
MGGVVVAMTNTVVQRAYLDFVQTSSGYQPFTLSLYNNLFTQGTVNFYYQNNYTSWTIKDNLFDSETLLNSSTYSMNADYNGYRSGLTSLGGYYNKTGLVLDYQTGPAASWFGVLGQFYYPTTGGSTSLNSLRNAGSRLASVAGLYHFCSTVDNVKEQTSQVDLGYHAVAANVSGLPNDQDGDSIADAAEDRNGNGAYESAVDLANWTLADTDGDGVSDGEEQKRGSNPKVGAQSDPGGTQTQLLIFTPLLED